MVIDLQMMGNKFQHLINLPVMKRSIIVLFIIQMILLVKNVIIL